jgi:DNA-binding response OmpR family regulator
MGDYMKVLLVHTDSEVINEVKSFLGLCIVHYASDGADGLFAGRVEEYDIIVTALDLPLITGMEMVRALRNLSQNNKTPVIFIGNGTESDQCKALISRLNAGYYLRDELADHNFSGEWQNAKAELNIV